MSRTIECTIYKYAELSEKAKEKARDWYSQCVFDDEWWDCTYEDAARVGLKITYFDLVRSKHAEGELTGTVGESVRAIVKEHGKACGTYALALSYYRRRHNLKHGISHEGYTVEDFERDLLEEYASILQDEADYMQSTEYLEDGIIANEYEFDEDGSRA